MVLDFGEVLRREVAEAFFGLGDGRGQIVLGRPVQLFKRVFRLGEVNRIDGQTDAVRHDPSRCRQRTVVGGCSRCGQAGQAGDHRDAADGQAATEPTPSTIDRNDIAWCIGKPRNMVSLADNGSRRVRGEECTEPVQLGGGRANSQLGGEEVGERPHQLVIVLVFVGHSYTSS